MNICVAVFLQSVDFATKQESVATHNSAGVVFRTVSLPRQGSAQDAVQLHRSGYQEHQQEEQKHEAQFGLF